MPFNVSPIQYNHGPLQRLAVLALHIAFECRGLGEYIASHKHHETEEKKRTSQLGEHMVLLNSKFSNDYYILVPALARHPGPVNQFARELAFHPCSHASHPR